MIVTHAGIEGCGLTDGHWPHQILDFLMRRNCAPAQDDAQTECRRCNLHQVIAIA